MHSPTFGYYLLDVSQNIELRQTLKKIGTWTWIFSIWYRLLVQIEMGVRGRLEGSVQKIRLSGTISRCVG